MSIHLPETQKSTTLTAVSTGFLIAIISYYSWVAFRLSENFSFSKDQLWAIPEAISLLTNISLNKSNEIVVLGWQIPIATGGYGGAYKTYLYALTFSIFTLPTEKIVIITNVTLAIIFFIALIGKIKSKSLTTLLPILLLPFLDLHFLFGSILDAGPILIQLIFLSLTIKLLAKIITGEPTNEQIKRYLLLSLCCCGFAINDKLIILPNLLAPFIAILIVDGRRVLKIIASFKFLIIASLVILISTQPFSYFLLREGTDPMFSMVGTSFSIKTSFLQRISELWLNFFGLSNASYFFDIMTGENPQNHFSYTKILATISLLGIMSVLIQKAINQTGEYRLLLYLTLTFLLSFLLQACVQGLNRPWHIFQLYPSLILLACESIRHLNKSRFLRPIIYTGAFILIALQSQNIIATSDKMENSFGVNEFSNNIKECAEKLVKNNLSDLYILNYSVGEPLFVYSKGKVRYHDLYWAERSHILDQLKNNYLIQRIAYRTPVKTKITLEPQLEFLKGPLDDAEKLRHFTEEITCKDKAGSIITIAKRNL